MSISYTMRLQKSGGGFWLSVPKELVESEGWQKGDTFFPIPVENGVQFIRKVRKNG
jgi:hypothetical protein